jgi:hypothetical protein
LFQAAQAKNQNMNLLALSELAQNKKNCVQSLQEPGILHTERKCGNSHIMSLSLTIRQDRWRCHECKQDITVRSGKFFRGDTSVVQADYSLYLLLE